MQPDERDISTLAQTRTIELTTWGRRSGRPARIEIWWFHVDSRFIITGSPGRRDWFANVNADPRLIIHANGRDYPGAAKVIIDKTFRTTVFTDPDIGWYRTQAELDLLVDSAPMIEILFAASHGPWTSSIEDSM